MSAAAMMSPIFHGHSLMFRNTSDPSVICLASTVTGLLSTLAGHVPTAAGLVPNSRRRPVARRKAGYQ
ncbi:hypothetical protein [Acrocarpospora macrocephala]|uniref:hypothetical protein n=1 Tax=Acrocarpospora macrocephala TaxID=150177 RepID=UPI0012D2CD03|nr:hypothetical protein [Acrocarpospora macrocephala]